MYGDEPGEPGAEPAERQQAEEDEKGEALCVHPDVGTTEGARQEKSDEEEGDLAAQLAADIEGATPGDPEDLPR